MKCRSHITPASHKSPMNPVAILLNRAVPDVRVEPETQNQIKINENNLPKSASFISLPQKDVPLLSFPLPNGDLTARVNLQSSLTSSTQNIILSTPRTLSASSSFVNVPFSFSLPIVSLSPRFQFSPLPTFTKTLDKKTQGRPQLAVCLPKSNAQQLFLCLLQQHQNSAVKVTNQCNNQLVIDRANLHYQALPLNVTTSTSTNVLPVVTTAQVFPLKSEAPTASRTSVPQISTFPTTVTTTTTTSCISIGTGRPLIKSDIPLNKLKVSSALQDTNLSGKCVSSLKSTKKSKAHLALLGTQNVQVELSEASYMPRNGLLTTQSSNNVDNSNRVRISKFITMNTNQSIYGKSLLAMSNMRTLPSSDSVTGKEASMICSDSSSKTNNFTANETSLNKHKNLINSSSKLMICRKQSLLKISNRVVRNIGCQPTNAPIVLHKTHIASEISSRTSSSPSYPTFSDNSSDESECPVLIRSRLNRTNIDKDDVLASCRMPTLTSTSIRQEKLQRITDKHMRQLFSLRRSYITNELTWEHHGGKIEDIINCFYKEISPGEPVGINTKEWNAASQSSKNLRKHFKRRVRKRPRLSDMRACLHRDDEDLLCSKPALPYTNHCIKHVMYSVDQQLYGYCTAKCPNNVQCCVPVLNIRHGPPLCSRHISHDVGTNSCEASSKKAKKKSRSFTLRRPPKKGKKRRREGSPVHFNISDAEPTLIRNSDDDDDDDDEFIRVVDVVEEPSDQSAIYNVISGNIERVHSSDELEYPSFDFPSFHNGITSDNLCKETMDEVVTSDLLKDLDLHIDPSYCFIDGQEIHDVFSKIPVEVFDFVPSSLR